QRSLSVGSAYLFVVFEDHPRNPPDPLPDPVANTRIELFAVSPADSWVTLGEAATLTWSVADCGSDCRVGLPGQDGLRQTLDIRSVPAAGSQTVTPHFNARYTLSLTSAGAKG